MDLIYTDGERSEMGVIQTFSIDLAFGEDENDFELTVDIKNKLLARGYYIYFMGTGYGGIVDGVRVDTDAGTLTYSGRTFEGILENKVILPPDGAAYYVATGDANAVIADLIDKAGVSDLFVAETATVGDINNYNIRYNNLYDTLVDMLYLNNLKLDLKVGADSDNNTVVKIQAVPLVRLSEDNEWFGDDIKVKIEQLQRQTNHLVCLGNGELTERHVIHIFCDENGIVQAYASSDTPYKDSDYILDESNKVLTGEAEVAQVYDNSSAADINNYVLLTSKPSTWDDYTTQYKYYTKDGSDYTQVEPVQYDAYELLDSAPANWYSNYTRYYTIIDGVYTQVPIPAEYTLQTSQPSDWASNYSAYYELNGTSYESVEIQDYYTRLTSEPSDWATNYSAYYTTDGLGNYSSVGSDSASTLSLLTSQPSGWYSNYGNYYDYAGNAVTRITEYFENTLNVFPYAGYGGVSVTNLRTGNYASNAYEYIPAYTFKMAVVDRNAYRYTDSARTAKSYYPLTIYTQMEKVNTELATWRSRNRTYNSELATYNSLVAHKKTVPAALKTELAALKSEISTWLATIYNDYDYLVALGGSYGVSFMLWAAQANSDVSVMVLARSFSSNAYFIDSRSIVPPWQPNMYYAKTSYSIAPTWNANDYYSMYYDTPTWEENKYYTATHTPPTFVRNKYYKQYDAYESNTWASNKYYELFVDHYYNLVQAAISKLADLRKSDSVSADLDTQKDFNIGDVIVVNEETTNTTVEMVVVKKILSGTNNDLKVTYELGGM